MLLLGTGMRDFLDSSSRQTATRFATCPYLLLCLPDLAGLTHPTRVAEFISLACSVCLYALGPAGILLYHPSQCQSTGEIP